MVPQAQSRQPRTPQKIHRKGRRKPERVPEVEAPEAEGGAEEEARAEKELFTVEKEDEGGWARAAGGEMPPNPGSKCCVPVR